MIGIKIGTKQKSLKAACSTCWLKGGAWIPVLLSDPWRKGKIKIYYAYINIQPVHGTHCIRFKWLRIRLYFLSRTGVMHLPTGAL